MRLDASHSAGESAHSIFARGSNECTHTQKERRPAAKIHFISVSRSAGVCVWESRESLAAESHTLSWRTVNKYIYRMACTQFACQNVTLHAKKMKIKRARTLHIYKVWFSHAMLLWDAKSKSALKLHTLGAPVPKSGAQFHSQFLRSFSARETPARPTSSVSRHMNRDEKRLLCPKRATRRSYRAVCMWSHADARWNLCRGK